MSLGWFWLAALLLPPALALVLLPPFGQRMVTLVGIYALMGLGYQLVFGQLGALNLAQGALFGVGAYATALAAPAARRAGVARGDPGGGDPGGTRRRPDRFACSRTTSRSPPWRWRRSSISWPFMPRA